MAGPATTIPITAKTANFINVSRGCKMASRQQEFVEATYWDARAAGLNDTQARLAAAQASLETGYGKSVAGNNYFGIKSGRSWNGPVVNVGTWEEENGARVNQNANFRAYEDPRDSFVDYYSFMADRFPDAFYADSFPDAVSGLNAGKKGGYATDTAYDDKLSFINDRFDPNPFGFASRESIPTPTARPEYVEAPMVADYAPAVDPFSIEEPAAPSLDMMAFNPAENPDLAYTAPGAPEMAYSQPQAVATPFDNVLNMPEAPEMPAVSVAAYTDPAVSAPNYAPQPAAPPLDKTTEIAAAPRVAEVAQVPDVPDMASLKDQYASYGQGRALKEQAINLALDVADAAKTAPRFSPAAAQPATVAGPVKAPTIEEVSQPQRSPASQPRSTPSAAQRQGSTVDGANRQALMRDTEKLNSLQQQDKIVNGIVGALGSVLGGMFLGPVGGILGYKVAPQLLAPITNQARNFYPTAPVNPNASGKSSGYSSLGDYGRETYSSSGNFRDAVDAVDRGTSQGGLW